MKHYQHSTVSRKIMHLVVLLAIASLSLGPMAGTAHAAGCFDLNKIASPAVGGSVNVDVPPDCGAQYSDGTVVQITAIPNSKYSFGSWSGDATGSTNPTTVTMSTNRTVTASFPPTNDKLASATVISAISYTDILDTTASDNSDAGDPDGITCTIDDSSSATEILSAGWKSLWYKYIPNQDQYVQVDTIGSKKVLDATADWDTYIAVYHDSVSTANLVACNDNYQFGLTSKLTLSLTAGTTYYFEVAQFKNYTGGPGDTLPQAANLNFHINITNVQVSIGSLVYGRYYVYPNEEQRYNYNLSDGPVEVGSSGATNNIAAIRLQSYANSTLYSYIETMGTPSTLLSYKYYFPTYNNTWAPLNSQLRFANINNTAIYVKVTIGASSWTYSVPANSERREYLPVSGGPVIIESVDAGGISTPTKKIIAAIRLQSYANNTLYSFTETMGVPVGLLSYKYYFPTYNNTWIPLNSQLRFSNINNTPIDVKVTIGASSWTYSVPANSERREYLPVSGGPVVIESTDNTKQIIAAIRLQSFANSTLFSFSETMGIPVDQLSNTTYFSTYNNTWAPLNSQLRFSVP